MQYGTKCLIVSELYSNQRDKEATKEGEKTFRGHKSTSAKGTPNTNISSGANRRKKTDRSKTYCEIA